MATIWKQSTEHCWLANDGRRVQYSPASQAFLVFNKGGYLGKDGTLAQAQHRTDYSPTYLQDTEGNLPTFLLLSTEERATNRGQAMKTKVTTEAPVLTAEQEAAAITDVTREYNKLAQQAADRGLAYKQVERFGDLQVATESLAMVQSSLRAAAGADKGIVNQKRASAKKGVAKSEGVATSVTKEGDTGTGPATGETGAAPPKERSTMTAKTAKAAKKTSAKKASKGKAPKAAKTAKVAKAANGGTKTRIGEDAKCSVVGANPFREGTDRHTQLEMVKKGTVAAFVKAGGNRGYLSWFVRKGHAKVSGA